MLLKVGAFETFAEAQKLSEIVKLTGFNLS